ncbi:tetratricopeptide repeat protein [Vibrio stylophorae]|nr:tetratricopeptide repeat protein [Vibrio stylophorae]
MKKTLLGALLSTALLVGCATTAERQFTLQNETHFSDAQVTQIEQVSNQDSAGLYQVGRLLISQAEQPENIDQGVVDLKSAAKLGNVDAITLLGDLYYKGFAHIPANLTESLSWFEQGAKLNDAYSLYSAAFMYERGQGTEVNIDKAINQYKKAAELGSGEAALQLAYLYDQGKYVTQDQSLAVTWYEKAAALDNATARYNLAVAYQNGEGVTQDSKKALELFKQGEENGHAMSIYSIGNFYFDGIVVKKDYKQALDYYFQAALLGSPQAQADIGYMYYKGFGIEQDPIMAMAWFMVSAENGNEVAQDNMQKLARDLSEQDLQKAHRIQSLINQELETN